MNKTKSNTAESKVSMVELRNVTITAGDLTLLSDVSATFSAGTLTALVGRNGSGKSTLLRAIAGLGSVFKGDILIANHKQPIDAALRARTLAFVNTQRIRVSNMRVTDIVALGRAPYTGWIGNLTQHDKTIVNDSLEIVGMTEFSNRTIDTLSDGECQRVMIARALAQQTPVILLDEPTSFLDLPNRYQLMELLGQLSHEHGKCIILSTHELDIAIQTADDIALIDTPSLITLKADNSATRSRLCEVFKLPSISHNYVRIEDRDS